MPKASTTVRLLHYINLETHENMKMKMIHLSGWNLRENCCVTGHKMAAERPQGGLELEFI